MKASQVFTPGKEPGVTYIDDHLQGHATVLRDALEVGASVISLSGPSKSGKTVFIEKVVGQGALIPVTGAGVTSSKILWDRVFHFIGTPTTKSVTTTDAKESSIGAKVGGEAGLPLIAKGTGEISAGLKSTGSTAEKLDSRPCNSPAARMTPEVFV